MKKVQRINRGYFTYVLVGIGLNDEKEMFNQKNHSYDFNNIYKFYKKFLWYIVNIDGNCISYIKCYRQFDKELTPEQLNALNKQSVINTYNGKVDIQLNDEEQKFVDFISGNCENIYTMEHEENDYYLFIDDTDCGLVSLNPNNHIHAFGCNRPDNISDKKEIVQWLLNERKDKKFKHIRIFDEKYGTLIFEK